MAIWITLALLASAGAVLARMPRTLLHRYRSTFAARHGISVQVGLTALITITLSMLLATLLEPGTRPLMEIVDAAVVALALAAGGIDLYRFARAAKTVR